MGSLDDCALVHIMYYCLMFREIEHLLKTVYGRKILKVGSVDDVLYDGAFMHIM